MLLQLLQGMARRLSEQGFDDLNLKLDHLLLAFDWDRRLVCDANGEPDVRLCSFELLRRRLPEIGAGGETQLRGLHSS
jgi:hypothetical protein